ncbi:MAG: TonB-dependent receptor [Labilibaculum sp.]|nr:TonB-dependent receptor [Labilibaculum sp.]
MKKCKTKWFDEGFLHYPKFVRVLKLFLILAFIMPTTFASYAYSQTTKLSVNMSQATILDVFNYIESKTEFQIAYNSHTLDIAEKIDLNVDNKTVNEVLDIILKSSNLKYEFIDKYIVVTDKESDGNYKNQIKQNNSNVSGTVTNTEGEPIPGITVIIKKTTTGTITDINGNYSLANIPNDAILVFSFIGMKTQEILVSGKISIDVVMAEDAIGLEEVVAIGYGVVKKSNLTGAVSSVKMDEIPQIATNNISNVLVGQVSGLSIRQNSAAPGGGYDMVIRGAASTGAGNSPLYVVDGFPGGDINTINPDDIESVEVLKDASATAIYGARAANGVILINTKKGKAGTMEISFNASVSAQSIANPYEMVSSMDYMKMSNAFFKEEWMYENGIAPYGNVDPSTVGSTPSIVFTDDQIANTKQSTNWFDEITRTGLINKQNISINGGKDNVRYLFSLGHLGHKGVILNSGLKQYMGRLNLEIDLSKWLTTGVSVSASQSYRNNIAQAGGPNNAGMIRDAMYYPQYLPVYDDEGNYTINPDHSSTANPVSWKDVDNKNNTYRTLVNNFWNVKFSSKLNFRVNWGVNSSFNQSSYFVPKTHLTGIELNTTASLSEERKNDYLLDATLTYSKELFGNHQFKAMAGYAYQKFNTESVYASNSDFLTDVFGSYNLEAGGDLTKSVSSSKSITKYLSYFGRINYDIADKYLFTFTFRADGSDKFGAENKFGYFPSGAFAWRIIEEGFMKSQNTISNLKLRVSLGQTGNAQIGGNTYGFYAAGANYVLGNTLVSGVSENQLPNPKLKWETTTEYNVGIDWALFNDHLSGSFEYYNKVISDLLDRRTVGSYYPVEDVADNLGKTQSKGFEIQIKSINISRKDFMWSTNLNLYQYKDSWKERNPFTILSIYEGETDPLHVDYGYLSDGLIQAGEVVSYMDDAPPGSIKVRDINGWLKDGNGDFILSNNGNKQLSGEPDNTIDDADKVIIREKTPKLNFGISNTIKYKGFDLSFFFYGEIGRQLNNVTRMDFLRADRFRFSDNVTTDAFDRWSSTNPDGIYPSGLYPKYESNTDFYIEDADFIRLKNLTLGYTLPTNLTNGLFKKSRIYMDVQNLFVITNYSGSDPETDSFSAYPNQKTFTIGVNLSF